MLTRAFLLLLAMMTGLSAAQAADMARPVQGSAEWQASASLPVVARAVLDVKRQAQTRLVASVEDVPALGAADFPLPAPHQAPVTPRTYRADRAQE